VDEHVDMIVLQAKEVSLSHSTGLPSLSRKYSGHPGFLDTMWSQILPRSSQSLAQTRGWVITLHTRCLWELFSQIT
jgi:hypothetical protein